VSKGVARALLRGVGIEAVGFDLGETLLEYEGVPLDWRREYPAARDKRIGLTRLRSTGQSRRSWRRHA
jgi:hypothetical protein